MNSGDHKNEDRAVTQQDISYYGVRLGRLYDRIPPGQYIVFLEKPEPDTSMDATVRINRIDERTEFVLRPHVTEEHDHDKK